MPSLRHVTVAVAEHASLSWRREELKDGAAAHADATALIRAAADGKPPCIMPRGVQQYLLTAGQTHFVL